VKKLIALLLAALLPMYAMAETHSLSVRITADEPAVTQLMQESFRQVAAIDNTQAKEYAKALAAILQKFHTNIIIDDQAMAVEIFLHDVPLLDLTCHMTEDEIGLTSSLIPAYAVVIPREGNSVQAFAATMEAVQEWAKSISSQPIHGVFTGDAYDGGVQGDAWSISGKDMTALISVLRDDRMTTLLKPLLEMAGIDAEALFADNSWEKSVLGTVDQHQLILRSAKDTNGSLKGLSLTMMRGTDQVATLSLGLEEQGLQFVAGLGLSEQNYWWEFAFQSSQREEQLFLKGESREWVADKWQAFSYVKAEEPPVFTSSWKCTVTQTASRSSWSGSVEATDAAEASVQMVCTFSGNANHDTGYFETKASMIQGSDTLLTVEVANQPADALSPYNPALVKYNLGDSRYSVLQQQFVFGLGERLLQILLLSILMTLGDIFAD